MSAPEMTTARAREVLEGMRQLSQGYANAWGHDSVFTDKAAALTHALAALDAVTQARALVAAAYKDGSPLIDREALRRALDGEAPR